MTTTHIMIVVHAYIMIIIHAQDHKKQNFVKLHNWQDHLHFTHNFKTLAADVFSAFGPLLGWEILGAQRLVSRSHVDCKNFPSRNRFLDIPENEPRGTRDKDCDHATDVVMIAVNHIPSSQWKSSKKKPCNKLEAARTMPKMTS